jgi:hypothetical protein
LQLTPDTPERASVAVPVVVMLDVNSVVPSAGETNENTGGVVSMLTVADAVAWFPAMSEAVPVTT